MLGRTNNHYFFCKPRVASIIVPALIKGTLFIIPELCGLKSFC